MMVMMVVPCMHRFPISNFLSSLSFSPSTHFLDALCYPYLLQGEPGEGASIKYVPKLFDF